MTFTHGTLENEILNAVWILEENKSNIDNISVSEVLNIINEKGCVRAYTTVKTVMDRLVEKQLLKRQKTGKKYCYDSMVSREKMAEKAINKLVKQYFNNDKNLLFKTLEKQCLSMKV